jgi:hypothetical protein
LKKPGAFKLWVIQLDSTCTAPPRVLLLLLLMSLLRRVVFVVFVVFAGFVVAGVLRSGPAPLHGEVALRGELHEPAVLLARIDVQIHGVGR